MEIHDLTLSKGSRKNRKRVGRGSSSGSGTTSGRGTKGQKARSGGKVRIGFEGGQMPLVRRLPKRGFSNVRFAKKFEIINLGRLNDIFSEGEEVNKLTLVSKGLIKGNKDGVKILGKGDIDKRLLFNVERVSKSAAVKIKAAKGITQTSE